MNFDPEEGAEFHRLVPLATLFPLTVEGGLPAGAWGALEAGECIRADDPRQGYGIATGERSGGLVVIDVDQKNGKDGAASLAKLPPLPPTLTVTSPSGGLHLYFEHPGRFQSNAGKLGPGLDIRAEGGYVRIPGSPHPRHPGRFKIARILPPALLPPAWADMLPRQGEQTAHVPAPAGLDVEPDELRARLVRLSKGRHGPIWESWRKVARGERFVRVAPNAPEGGVDTHLQAMFAALAREWPDVSEGSFSTLLGPSFGHLRCDDLAAGNPVYSLADMEKKWTRARSYATGLNAKAKTAEDFARGLVESTQGALPMIVAHTGHYYVRPPEPGAEYVGPKVRTDLWLTCRDVWGDAGPDVYRTTAKGAVVRMSPDDLVETHGRSVDAVVHDTSAPEPAIDGRSLVLPAAAVVLAPAYSAPVERWLRACDPSGSLEDWLAIVTDLKYAAPALWLTGSGGVGKSLLAAGLAKIWGGIPTPMAKAFGTFNDALLRCPLVEAAEEIPKNYRGYQDTEKLKEIITETERKVNEKHKPIRDVLGAMRVILSSNNTNLIRNSGDLTADDAAALADRFVHIRIPSSARDTLPPARTIQDTWIDGGAIAKHALWLAETRKVPFGPRLRMAPHASYLRRLFVVQPGAGAAVAQAVYTWIVQTAASAKGPEMPWSISGDIVCTSAEAVLRKIADDRNKPSPRAVGQALQRFAPNGRELDGRWPVHVDLVRTWAASEAFGNPRTLEQALERLNA